MNKVITVFDLCCKVQKAMEDKNFSQDTIRRYESVFNDFITYSGNAMYSQALGRAFLVKKLSELGGLSTADDNSRLSHIYKQSMYVLAEFYNFGILHRYCNCSEEFIWPAEFSVGIEAFLSDIVTSGLSRGYYRQLVSIIHDLILYLDDHGITKLDEIKASDNDGFIATFTGLCTKTVFTRIGYLRRFYRFLYLNNYISIPLGERLPQANIQGRTYFPVLWTEDDISKIKESAERVSPSGKRSYAMILLASELGLRIGDIRSLKFSDIDWERKQLNIVQNKTQKALCLPMTDSVGWALIDYLKNGRPITDSKYIFVKHRPPFDEFPMNSTLNGLLTRVLIKADISPEKKQHIGWHTFRRSLATNLLQHQVPMNTITEILGHTDPDIAGRHYVQICTESLRKCVLEVEVKDRVQF